MLNDELFEKSERAERQDTVNDWLTDKMSSSDFEEAAQNRMSGADYYARLSASIEFDKWRKGE